MSHYGHLLLRLLLSCFVVKLCALLPPKLLFAAAAAAILPTPHTHPPSFFVQFCFSNTTNSATTNIRLFFGFCFPIFLLVAGVSNIQKYKP